MKQTLRVCLATTKPSTFFGPFASLGHHNSPHQINHLQNSLRFQKNLLYLEVDKTITAKNLQPHFKVPCGLVVS